MGVVALMLLVPGSIGAYFYSLGRIHTTQTIEMKDAFPPEALRVPAPEVPAGQAKAMNILVLGSDSRDTSSTAAAASAAGTASNQRSDTLILVHIPASRSQLYGISLMRDLWVNIPGHGEAKINAALAYGGVPLVVQTVESLLQQRIDQVVMIDFAGFKGIVDALGGVEVDIKAPFTAVRETSSYHFKAGSNTLDGTEALAFVRERYAFADGDYQRVRNQQLLLEAVLAKTFGPGTLLNPVVLRSVLESLAPYLNMVPGMDVVEAGRLAFSLREVQGSDIVAFTLPTAGTATSTGGQSIVLPDLAAVEGIKAALSKDSLGDYAAATSLGNKN